MSYDPTNDELAAMVDGPAGEKGAYPDVEAPLNPVSDDAAAVAEAVPSSTEEAPVKLSRREARAARKAANTGPEAQDAAKARPVRRRSTRLVPVRTGFDFTAGRYAKVRRTRLLVVGGVAILAALTLLLVAAGFASVTTAQGIHNDTAALNRASAVLQSEIDRLATVNGVSGADITADVDARTAGLNHVALSHVQIADMLDVLHMLSDRFGTITTVDAAAAEEGFSAVKLVVVGSTNADARDLRDALIDYPHFTSVELLTNGSFGEIQFTATFVADLAAMKADEARS